MKHFIRNILFVLLISLIEAKYEIILDRVELLFENDSYFDQGTFRIRKFNRSATVFSGVFELKKPVSNDFVLSFEAFNLSGGQYKKIFGNILGNVCDFLYDKSSEKTVKSALASSNSTLAYGTCPIPAQVVNVKDYVPLDEGNFIPDYMPGNERWRVDLWVSKDDVKVTGGRAYAILRDNQKLFDSKW